MTTLQNKVDNLENGLNSLLFERGTETKCLTNALLSRQHVCLLGPPGIAKSMMVRSLMKLIGGMNTEDLFEWCVGKFDTPDSLFGPVSLRALEQDKYIRNTEHKLPRAKLAFLDEGFKASTALLNTLLPLLMERLFYNNGTPVEVPLATAVIASNETPENNSELAALWDRIAFRIFVKPLRDDSNFVRMMEAASQRATAEPVQPVITWDELLQAQKEVKNVVLSEETSEALALLRNQLRAEGITPSDRRFVECIPIIKAQAWRAGRETTTIDDTRLLANVLWNNQPQIAMVRKLVLELANPFDKEALEILDSVEVLAESINELIRTSTPDNTVQRNNKAIEYNTKLDEAAKELEQLKNRAANENKSCEHIKPAIERVVQLSKTLLKEVFEYTGSTDK